MSDKKKYDKISELMGIENDVNLPEKVNVEQVPEKHEENEEKTEEKFNEDFDDSRKIIKRLSEKGEQMLDHYQEFLYQAESPRAFEVYSHMIKNLSELQKDLMQLHKNSKDMKENEKAENPNSPMNIQNANIVVGTSSDMLKKLKNEEGKDE